MELINLLFLITGAVLGFAIGWLLSRKTTGASENNDQSETFELQRENTILNTRIEEFTNRLKQLEQELEVTEQSLLNKEKELASERADSRNMLEKLETQKKDLTQLHEKFEKDFENLATKILKANTSEFSENSKKNLAQVLDPLKERIVNFEKQVQEKYIDETKERSKLVKQIEELAKLNQSIGEEAQHLTNALKGDTKKQGNWGELILERILEDSGLTKDREYELQYSMINDEGSRIQPDVVVKLPDNKHIIIDSKVSLNAYQNYANSEDDQERERYLKEHVISLRNHIRQLSEKNYSSGKAVNSPDFVLLFVNIESGFSAAWKADQDLYSYASQKKIYIVSPSTLLAALRTISSVWKHERQTQNAIEIAEQSGRLYDKFVSFTEDLLKIKKGIDTSNDAFQDAFNKLQSGKGNLISRAEKLKSLGVKSKKELSRDFTSSSEEDETQMIEKEN